LEIVDVIDDCLLKDTTTFESVLSQFPGFPASDPINVQQVLAHLPWGSFRDHMQKATNDAYLKLIRSPSPIKVLATHFCFYNGGKGMDEFRVLQSLPARRTGTAAVTCPNPSQQFCKPPFVRVITLVDDVFDAYLHLSRKPTDDDQDDVEVFSDWGNHHSNRYHDMVQAAGDTDLHAAMRLDAAANAAAVVRRLLAWRQSELLASENYASTNGIDFALLGVKQSRQVLEALLGLGSHLSETVYLSHPITDVRREAISKRTSLGDDPLVKTINGLPQQVYEQTRGGLSVLVPTAIDELRFETTPLSLATSPSGYRVATGRLDERWPTTVSEEQLIWKPPASVGSTALV
jgi:hypothetical protein